MTVTGVINIPGLVAVILFYILMLGIGIWASQRKKARESSHTSDNVMLAGRDIGVLVGILTMTATWVGGGYINGTAELIAKPSKGLVWCQAPFCYSTSLIIGGLLFAKQMRSAGYVTMLDPFQIKLGDRMGGLLYIPALMAEVLWSAAILAALGSTLSVIVGLPDEISIIVSACIAVIYTLFGGLYSVAYTDVIQIIFIPIGLVLSIPFALQHPAVTPISETQSEWLGQIHTEDIGLFVDKALVMIMGGIPWQAYFQRVLACKTPNQARVLSFVAGVGCFLMAIPSVLIGAIAASTDWNATGYRDAGGTLPLDYYQYKLVLPMVLQYLCPIAVSFIGLGSVSAAVMSSSDSSILSASSMFGRNIYKLVFRPKASEREIIWVIRGAIFVCGAMATLLAITIKSIYGLFYLCSDLVYVIIFPQLVCVVYLKATNTYGSLVSYVLALLLRFCGGEPLLGLPPAIIYPGFNYEHGYQGFPHKTLAMLVSFILLVGVSYLTKYLFESGKISMKYDYFKCFTVEERRSNALKSLKGAELELERREGVKEPLNGMEPVKEITA